MRTTTFTCDVCGVICDADPGMEHRPMSKEWIQFAMTPYHGQEGHPHHVPSAFRDVCSTKCLEQLLMSAAARLVELRGGS